MKDATITFVTDTATMCVYDLASLRHRYHDDDDWWADPAEELAEVRRGNAIFINLGSDGRYTIDLAVHERREGVEAAFRCPSVKVFVGAAEVVTSGGMEPTCLRGGTFLSLARGNYLLRVTRIGTDRLKLSLAAYDGAAHNSVRDLLRI